MHCRYLALWLVLASVATLCLGDVIPFCPFAKLISEDITVTLHRRFNRIEAEFEGDFLLGDLWPRAGTMGFPVPANAAEFQVARTTGGAWEPLEIYGYNRRDEMGELTIPYYYKTVLPEMPEMPVWIWDSPTKGSESFHISYKHELIRRDETFIFIYALGVEDFPRVSAHFEPFTEATVTNFDIELPDCLSPADVMYDHDRDPSCTVEDGHLVLTPAGPYYKDIIVFFNVAPGAMPPPGDANDDGTVDIADFNILKQNYGSGQARWEQGDFNGDGTVDISDFVILKRNFGS